MHFECCALPYFYGGREHPLSPTSGAAGLAVSPWTRIDFKAASLHVHLLSPPSTSWHCPTSSSINSLELHLVSCTFLASILHPRVRHHRHFGRVCDLSLPLLNPKSPCRALMSLNSTSPTCSLLSPRSPSDRGINACELFSFFDLPLCAYHDAIFEFLPLHIKSDLCHVYS